MQPLRDLGERQRLLLGEYLEDGLERAVAAGAVQAQLVAEAARLRELPAGREQRSQGADRVGVAARCGLRGRLGYRSYMGRPSVGQCVHAPGQLVAPALDLVLGAVAIAEAADVIVAGGPGPGGAHFRP